MAQIGLRDFYWNGMLVEDEARGARVRPALFRRGRPRRHSGRRTDCEVRHGNDT